MPAIELWDLSRLVRADSDLRALFDPRPRRGAARRDPHAIPGFARSRDALDALPGRLGLPLLRRADADGPELPGRSAARSLDLLKAYCAATASRRPTCSRARRPSAFATPDACLRAPPAPAVRYLPFVRQSAVVAMLLRWTQRVDQPARARAAQAGAPLQPPAPHRAAPRRPARRTTDGSSAPTTSSS